MAIFANMKAALANAANVLSGAALVAFKPTTMDGATFLSNGTSSTVCKVLSERVSVRQFGAVGDGVTNDATAINNAISALGTSGFELVFPPGDYRVNSQINLPVTTNVADFRIVGYGAVISTTSAITIMANPVPADTATASNRQNSRYIIEGLRFVGSENSSQRGLALHATYGSVIRDCRFQYCGTGLDLIFALMARVESCFSGNNITHGFRARTGVGVWGDADYTNSQSNHTVFQSCRDFATGGQLTQFLVEGCSGCGVYDCIVEGGNPVESIKFNGELSTIGVSFFVRNLHAENTPTGSILRMMPHAICVIDGLFSQVGGSVIVIDATGANDGAQIFVRNIAGINGLMKRGNFSCMWTFENGSGSYGQTAFEDSANWDAGELPAYISVTRRATPDNYPTWTGGPYGFPRGVIPGGATDADPRIIGGSADPEGSAIAGPGSMYLRSNGSWYRKTTGTGSTGWVVNT
jgi:hypothetical protein